MSNLRTKSLGRTKSSTVLRYARDPKSIILPRTNSNISQNEKKVDRKCAKFTCISFAIFFIASVWFILFLLVIFKSFQAFSMYKETENVNQTIYKIFENFTTNKDDNISLACRDPYIFSKTERKCVYSCGTFHSCGPTCLKAERVIFAILSICGILLSLVNIISWPFVGSLKSFTQIGIFFVICTAATMVSQLAIPGILGVSLFFCNNEYITVEEVNLRFSIRINIYGGSYDYINLLTLSWLFFSIFNISLMLFFPLKLQDKNKIKVAIILVEICLSVLPLVFILVPFTDGKRYSYNNDFGSAILPYPVYTLFLQFLPCVLIISVIFSIAICIITHLHLTKISMTKYAISLPKLTSLEKRFIIFSILMVVYLIYVFCNSVWSSFVAGLIKSRLKEHLMCISLLSRTISLESSLDNCILGDILMPQSWNSTICDETSFTQEDLYPGFLDIINHTILRSLWLPTFLLTMPDGLIELVSKWFKSIPCLKLKAKLPK